MQKPGKLFLAALTLWPLVYMVLFFAFIFSSILFRIGDPAQGGFPPAFVLLFAAHLLTMLTIMGLTIYYIVDVFRNQQVDKDKKILWAIVIFMGNMIAMPIYWYLYIWKEPAVAGSAAPPQLGGVQTSAWTSNVNASQQQPHEYVPPREPPDWRS